MYKRRRMTQGTRYAYQAKTKYQRRGTYTFKPGLTRTAGFYGRYNRASLKNSTAVNELKYIDTSIHQQAISGTGVICPPTDATFVKIPVGTGPSDRIGRQVNVKSINAYLTIEKVANSVLETNTIRLIWCIDTQCNGQPPTVTDVLTTASYTSFRNMANVRRFKILKDSEYILSSQNYNGTNFASVQKQVNFFAKVNTPIEYDASVTTGEITTIRSNNIFLIAISDLLSYCTLSGTVRVRYDD